MKKRYEKNFEIEHLKDTVKCLNKTLWVAIFMAFFLLFLVVKEKVNTNKLKQTILKEGIEYVK